MKKLFVFIILSSLSAYAQIDETPTLEQCLDTAGKATQGLQPKDVLFVFDIDNTVLQLKESFGSVQWFRWQNKLIQDGIEKDRIASSATELLTVQSWIYQLSLAQTPEPKTAGLIAGLQTAGYPVIFQTSRSTDVRDITERDLKLNHLLPLITTIGPKLGYPGLFEYPDKTSSQRPVSFQNGIYMSSGQDKGIWLGLLLTKVSVTPKHIVFVDDEIHNLQNVQRALESAYPLTLCRYGKLDTWVAEFNSSDKSKEIDLWKSLSALIKRLHASNL